MPGGLTHNTDLYAVGLLSWHGVRPAAEKILGTGSARRREASSYPRQFMWSTLLQLARVHPQWMSLAGRERFHNVLWTGSHPWARTGSHRAAIVSVAYVFFVIGILDILSVDDQSSGDDD
jgi:hypothetical protein